MKKIFTILLIISFVSCSDGGDDSSNNGGNSNNEVINLYFSEYAEGSSNNKYVEIYNASSMSVDLSNYQIKGTNIFTIKIYKL